MSITKVYIPSYELDYIESKPDRPAASYVGPECDNDYSQDVEFVDINSVWHDASEEPKPQKAILCASMESEYEVKIWVPMVASVFPHPYATITKIAVILIFMYLMVGSEEKDKEE